MNILHALATFNWTRVVLKLDHLIEGDVLEDFF